MANSMAALHQALAISPLLTGTAAKAQRAAFRIEHIAAAGGFAAPDLALTFALGTLYRPLLASALVAVILLAARAAIVAATHHREEGAAATRAGLLLDGLRAEIVQIILVQRAMRAAATSVIELVEQGSNVGSKVVVVGHDRITLTWSLKDNVSLSDRITVPDLGPKRDQLTGLT